MLQFPGDTYSLASLRELETVPVEEEVYVKDPSKGEQNPYKEGMDYGNYGDGPSRTPLQEYLERKNTPLLDKYHPQSWEGRPERSKSISDKNKQTNQVVVKRDCIVHTITRADTLHGLSLRYDCSVENIKKANGLWTNNIHERVELIIPVDRIPPTFKPHPEGVLGILDAKKLQKDVELFRDLTKCTKDECTYYMEQTQYEFRKAYELWKSDRAWEVDRDKYIGKQRE